MSPPIRDGSGSSIGAIRLGDGTEISEVRTGAGDVLFSGFSIPGSGLEHRYDATDIIGSDGDNIGTWADAGGSDDLTQNTSSKQPTLKTGQIGGKQVLRFDGTDDFLSTLWSNISQPFQIFVVAQLRNLSDFAHLFDGGTRNENLFRADNASPRQWEVRANSNFKPADADTNENIFTLLYDGGSSVLRINGTQTGTGTVDTVDQTGLTLCARGEKNLFGAWDVGEIIVYSQDLSTSDRDEVENSLSKKWGITI